MDNRTHAARGRTNYEQRMALIQCADCQKQVSDSADKCPNCAAKVKKPKKGVSRLTILFWGLLAIGVGAAVSNQKEPATPAEISAKKAASDKDFSRYKFASISAKFLKSSMRDPDSFVVETMLINDTSTVACVAYRSKNGFGGMNRDSAVVVGDKISRSPAVWNKNCAGKQLLDFTTDAIKATS